VFAGYADSSYVGPILDAMTDPPPTPQLEQLFWYARTLYALSAGRSGEARALAEEALATEAIMPRPADLFGAALGWATIIDGDTVAGLEQLQSGLVAAGYSGGMEFSGPLRFVLAAIQARRDESRAEGIRRLRNSFWAADLVYFAPAYLLLGQALEEEGDIAGAIEAYEQFIHLWQNADPELQPRVETARRALERLSAEAVN
jgi:tetratricopeptide (TPR) repeat protein